MEEERGNKGLWIGLIVAILAAVVFFVLWFLRGGDMNRLENRLRASQSEAASASQRLEGDLRRARSDIETGNRKVTELENRIRDEQRRASETLQQTERRLQASLDSASIRQRETTAELEGLRESSAKVAEEAESRRKEWDGILASARQSEQGANADLEEARKTIAALETRAGDAEASLSDLRKELTSSQEDLNTALAASRETSDLDNLKTDLARMETALAGAQNANAALEELRNRLSRTMEQERKSAGEREAALRAELDKLRAESPPAAQTPPASAVTDDAKPAETAGEDWDQKARELEAEWQKKVDAAAEEGRKAQDGIEREWREKARGLESELETERKTSAEAVFGLSALGKRLDAMVEQNKAESERLLGDRECQLRQEFDKEKEELLKRVKELEGALEEVRQPEETAAGLFPQRDSEPELLAASPSRTGFVFTGDPDHSVGRVVEKLIDGKTFLIKGGSEERVHPGMRFDVHRRENGRNRYVGMLKVVRTMDHYSMAQAVEDLPDARICPATGRAVLEPEAQTSPFAVAEDGQPIPLSDPAASGWSRDTPVIGDYIDNPFYDPARRKVFALAASQAADARVVALVSKTLGGIPCVDDGSPSVDYQLVASGMIESGNKTAPRRISLRYLENYAEVGE